MTSANDSASASAKEIFLAALERDSPEALGRYLDEACGGNAELRRRVEQLLGAHKRAGQFLGGSAATAVTVEQPTLGFLSPSNRPDSLGRLGHYEILEVIGSGGMGIVLRALDEKLQRVVAIKVMAESLAASPTARRRFIREAQACAAVRDEHVIGIHAVEETNQPPYLVMDYIDGQSLQQRIDRGGPLTLAEILRIGMQTATGLAAAHAQGLIHRDVKPANILLENGVQRVKITDFGLARLVDDASVTQSGVVAGTPQYMSPEQARGEAIDHRSDLFSLGSVLYAMCTGQAPFRGSTTVAVLRRVIDENPPPIRAINPDIPGWLVGMIDKLLVKQPADRFQSAAEVAELLGQELARSQQGGVQPGPVSAPPQPMQRRWHPWTMACVLVLVVAAGLAITEAAGITHLVASASKASARPGNPATERNDENAKAEADGGAASAKVAGLPVPAHPPQPFVILNDEGTTTGAFATLADAVLHSTEDDTIEIRGNGPFVSAPIRLTSRRIIRAGEGCRPVVTITPPAAEAPGFVGSAPLILEGIEFRACEDPFLINCVPGAVYVANCRLLCCGLRAQYVSALHVRNCQMQVPKGSCVVILHSDRVHAVIDNNVLAGGTSAITFTRRGDIAEQRLEFTRNLLAGQGCVRLFQSWSNPPGPVANPTAIDSSQNVFLDAAYTVSSIDTSARPANVATEDLLREAFHWQEKANLYSPGVPLLTIAGELSPGVEPLRPRLAVAELNDFWRLKDTASIQGVVRCQRGDIRQVLAEAGSELAPEDFRLRLDSAGYRAGPDGQDLGPDLDLVGPGAAYERWKQTPDYQQWLKETEQVK